MFPRAHDTCVSYPFLPNEWKIMERQGYDYRSPKWHEHTKKSTQKQEYKYVWYAYNRAMITSPHCHGRGDYSPPPCGGGVYSLTWAKCFSSTCPPSSQQIPPASRVLHGALSNTRCYVYLHTIYSTFLVRYSMLSRQLSCKQCILSILDFRQAAPDVVLGYLKNIVLCLNSSWLLTLNISYHLLLLFLFVNFNLTKFHFRFYNKELCTRCSSKFRHTLQVSGKKKQSLSSVLASEITSILLLPFPFLANS